MNPKKSYSGKKTTQKLVDIESKERLSSDSIGELCNKPELLKQYLDSSIANTYSEIMFRLTHEIYTEKKAGALWSGIVAHKENLEKQLGREVGVLVATLDYLTNISGDISSPKIIDDLRLEEAADMATHDFLTGLYLRSIFDFTLERMVVEHQRHNKELSLLLLDIDDFKKVNDNFGHPAGDDVLRRISKLIIGSIRKADFPARFGGEEIAILLPETSIEQATVLANKLCKNIRHCFAENGPAITVSIGVSSIHKQGATIASELVQKVDKAMYEAKRSGKNKIVTIP